MKYYVYPLVWIIVWIFTTRMVLRKTTCPVEPIDIFLSSFAGFVAGGLWPMIVLISPIYLVGVLVYRNA